MSLADLKGRVTGAQPEFNGALGATFLGIECQEVSPFTDTVCEV